MFARLFFFFILLARTLHLVAMRCCYLRMSNLTAVSIQSSFHDVITDVEGDRISKETFWVNFLPFDQLEDGSVNEELVTVSKHNGDVQYESTNGLKFSRESDHIYRVKYQGNDFSLTLPQRQLTIDADLSNATSFDVFPDSDTFLVGSDSGDLLIGNLEEKNVTSRIAGAHHSSVTKALFFPSGEVGLTAGLDYQIKIWDLNDGTNPRSFWGHQKRITDLAMIDRGRNFLSASKEGTVKLWDCASGLNILTLSRKKSFYDGINALLVPGRDTSEEHSDSYEVGTVGKVLFAGHESGVITVFDLGTKKESLSFNSLHSQVKSIAQVDDKHIAVGYSNGTIALWDVRNSQSPISQMQFGSEVDTLNIDSNGNLIVAFYTGYLGKMHQITERQFCSNITNFLVGFENSKRTLINPGYTGKYVLNENVVLVY